MSWNNTISIHLCLIRRIFKLSGTATSNEYLSICQISFTGILFHRNQDWYILYYVFVFYITFVFLNKNIQNWRGLKSFWELIIPQKRTDGQILLSHHNCWRWRAKKTYLTHHTDSYDKFEKRTNWLNPG